MKDQIDNLNKLIAGCASKDDLKKLEELLKQLKQTVDQHTLEIENLNDLVKSLKNFSGSSSQKDISGVSSNDILLLRSRVEYLES